MALGAPMSDAHRGVSPDEAFWQIVRRSRVPMVVFDDDGVYVEVNDAATRVMGRPREEIVGRRIGLATAPEHRAQLEQLWQLFRRRGRLAVPWQLERPEGPPVDVDVVATADTPVPGRHLGVYWVRASNLPRAARLSPREQQITQLLALGLTGEEIAQRLVLSPETVRTHIRNAMEGV